ncbi:hypothetical protein Droror1_Dr00024077 [Drosera rotundifolia]
MSPISPPHTTTSSASRHRASIHHQPLCSLSRTSPPFNVTNAAAAMRTASKGATAFQRCWQWLLCARLRFRAAAGVSRRRRRALEVRNGKDVSGGEVGEIDLLKMNTSGV